MCKPIWHWVMLGFSSARSRKGGEERQGKQSSVQTCFEVSTPGSMTYMALNVRAGWTLLEVQWIRHGFRSTLIKNFVEIKAFKFNRFGDPVSWTDITYVSEVWFRGSRGVHVSLCFRRLSEICKSNIEFSSTFASLSLSDVMSPVLIAVVNAFSGSNSVISICTL